MRTSEDIVERVRDATSIVDVVSEHVRLRKRGRNYLGLCPFHSEKTPSFNVLEDKGIFKCFGCGAAGDVYTFLMKLEGLTFPEAIEKLAGKAGIEYDKTQQRGNSEAEDRNEVLYNTCRDFAAFCYRSLRADVGDEAWQYLKSRGFGEEILKKFGVGYAPDGANSYLRSLEERNIQPGAAEQVGIVATGENGGKYDRFRARIIFPIFTPTGRIIAFGGRIMPNNPSADKVGKYINSPETQFYHKSQVLYGLFQAKDAIRKLDYALMVEGYADVVALSQAGFENSIAASGTSLTNEQLNLLRRYTRNIVLLFDADLAGKNAALRGIELALSAGFDVNTIVLPQGEDPDSFIKKEGIEAFQRQLDGRVSFVETKGRLLREQGLFDTPEGSSRAVRSLVETIAKVPDSIKQEFFIRRVAERFKLQETTLLAELQKVTKRGEREYVKKEIDRQINQPAMHDPFSSEPPMMDALPPTEPEIVLLKSFLDDTNTAYRAAIEMDFDYSLIENFHVSSLISYCIGKFEDRGENINAAEMIEAYREDASMVSLITDTLTDKEKLSEEWEIPVDDPVLKIRMSVRHAASLITRQTLERKREKLYSRVAEISDSDELDRTMALALDYAQKIEQLKDIAVGNY